jgi:hypothetical protein
VGRRITNVAIDVFFGCGIFLGFVAAALLAAAVTIGVPLAVLYGAVRVVRFAWQ